MRDGAARALAIAFAASVLLHVALFVVLPRARELTAILPPDPLPLIARLVGESEVKEPAKESPPEPEPRKLKPPPRPVVRPAPPPTPEPVPTPAPVAVPPPALTSAPSPLGAPAPALAPRPAPDASPPTAAPAPAVASAAPEPPAPPALDRGALARYREGVTLRAARYKRYPRVAIDNNWEGEVRVRMTIGADGGIAALQVVRGSGVEVLDRQALEMFGRAKPEVAIPAALRGRRFDLELRVVYSLRAG